MQGAKKTCNPRPARRPPRPPAVGALTVHPAVAGSRHQAGGVRGGRLAPPASATNRPAHAAQNASAGRHKCTSWPHVRPPEECGALKFLNARNALAGV